MSQNFASTGTKITISKLFQDSSEQSPNINSLDQNPNETSVDGESSI